MGMMGCTPTIMANSSESDVFGSLCHTYSHTHTHTLTHTHPSRHTLTHSHTLTLTLTFSHAHTHIHSHTLTLQHTPLHTHTLTLTLTHSRAHTHTRTHVHTRIPRSAHPTLRVRIELCDLGAEPHASQLGLLLDGLDKPPTQLLMSQVDAQELARSAGGAGR